MALNISISVKQFRHDSGILPVISCFDVAGTGFIKISDWQYLKYPGEAFAIEPPNCTRKAAAVVLRDCAFPSLTHDSGVSAASGNINRTSGSGFAGSKMSGLLSEEYCTVQAKIVTPTIKTGFSLQDSTNTIVHDYTDSTVAHAFLFGPNNLGTIYELGQAVFTFKYEEGETALIEVIEQITRYYLVSEQGEIRLIRTTRSKLTEDPKAEFMLFAAGASLEAVFINDNLKAETVFENVGVAYNQPVEGRPDLLSWQKWQNQHGMTSTGEALEMADKHNEFTYPSRKLFLQNAQLTPKAKSRKAFDLMVKFFQDHRNDTEFIYVDYARRQPDGKPSEWWAKFQTPLTDQTINSCLFDLGVSIAEDFRNDFVPRIADTHPPTVAITSVDLFSGLIRVMGTSDDDVLVTYVWILVNGREVGGRVAPNYDGTWSVTFAPSELLRGANVLSAVASDYNLNQAQSAEFPYYFLPDVVPPVLTTDLTLSTDGFDIIASWGAANDDVFGIISDDDYLLMI